MLNATCGIPFTVLLFMKDEAPSSARSCYCNARTIRPSAGWWFLPGNNARERREVGVEEWNIFIILFMSCKPSNILNYAYCCNQPGVQFQFWQLRLRIEFNNSFVTTHHIGDYILYYHIGESGFTISGACWLETVNQGNSLSFNFGKYLKGSLILQFILANL